MNKIFCTICNLNLSQIKRIYFNKGRKIGFFNKVNLDYKWYYTLLVCALLMSCTNNQYHFNQGKIFGTFYHITYENTADLHPQILEQLKQFDASLSTYNPKSTITKVNLNDSTVVLDAFFTRCFNMSKKISHHTDGAFDLTVAPLVNAWGFGFKNKLDPEKIPVDSLLQLVGYKKVKLENGKIIKADKRIMLDASAIAKGYGVDVIADFLEQKGVVNYLVEIGGEIRTHGISPKKRPWRVAIDKPIDDVSSLSREIQEVVEIQNAAMATSGNYRQFYVKNGKKYAHTIDPRKGYPVQHSLLSSTVVAPTCMVADAYATAFMVLGVEKSKKIVEANPNLEVLFIYSDKDGKLKTFVSKGLQGKILQ